MLGWFRSQLQEHGVANATQLLFRVAWSRGKTNLANRLLPERVSCPCCGWRGSRFYDYIELGYSVSQAACPRCDSHSRHRTLFLWLNQEYRLQERQGKALVFAPERSLAEVWNNASGLSVCRVDIESTRDVDLLVDLQELPFASDSMDLLWCHHVLEHVEDDRSAIRELHRVLRPSSGELIVSVPMELGGRTNEYGYPRKEESGHWRMYGDDFADRLAESGFSVEPVDYEIGEESRARYGITRERFYLCRKPVADRQQ